MPSPGDDGVELVLPLRGHVLESPVWDNRNGELAFVDIPVGHVHRWNPTTGLVRTHAVGQPVGAAALRESGGLVLAVRDGIAFLDDEGTVQLVVDVERDVDTNLMNDACCDAAGRLWAGTVATDEAAHAGTLYRIDPGGRVAPVMRGITISNGIGWSPDDRRMYYVDSPTGRVDVFDYDISSGVMGPRVGCIDVEGAPGAVPDGLAVDAAGFVWVAMWGGGVVRRYSPQGTLDREIAVGDENVTSCAFGGRDLRELYVTTARTEEADPTVGGNVYRVAVDVSGLPASPFAG